jgi:RNA polymerase sigma-70 factor (ECF subfamily)
MRSVGTDITPLLNEASRGDQAALAQLMPLVYGQLRRLAAHCMKGERADHTLQPTALVHEAYLLLAKQEAEWQNRAHFFAVAAKLMRRILVDHAKARVRKKRGGNQTKVSLEEVFLFSEDKSEALLALDESLTQLTNFDPRQGCIVEMRFFGGLEEKEIAGVLGVSVKTVKRDWQAAKLWLRADLRERDGNVPGEMGKS